jgi:hypothetical protein
MMRRFCAALLVLTAAGCGARSELWTPAADCTPLNIGIFGNPGAYSGPEFPQWLLTSGANAERLQTTPDEPLTEATLEPFDVVVLDWLTRDYTASEAATFAAWVRDGGGVVSMTGWVNVIADDWRPNSLLAPLGVAYSGPLISGPVTDLAEHPITDGLGSVVFEGGYAISDLGGQASTRTPIAFLPAAVDKVTVGYAIEVGTGRAFVWGDEWIEFSGQGSMFSPQLWVQMFEWIAPAKKCALAPPS